MESQITEFFFGGGGEKWRDSKIKIQQRIVDNKAREDFIQIIAQIVVQIVNSVQNAMNQTT